MIYWYLGLIGAVFAASVSLHLTDRYGYPRMASASAVLLVTSVFMFIIVAFEGATLS